MCIQGEDVESGARITTTTNRKHRTHNIDAYERRGVNMNHYQLTRVKNIFVLPNAMRPPTSTLDYKYERIFG